jgi:UDP-GlcNAc:undecaprenyl-phosphate/decaprenyl-phosphate GlcNAc-1-phosphate transferase
MGSVMGIQPMVFCALSGCLISLLIIPAVLLPGLLRSLAMRRGTDPFDAAREPSKTLASLGGIALATSFLGVAACIYFLYPAIWTDQSFVHLAIVWTGLAMFFLGLWDDHRPLERITRLLIQTVIAFAAYAQGIQVQTLANPLTADLVHFGDWSALVTVLWLVGLTNLIRVAGRWNGRASGIGLALITLLTVFVLVGFGSGSDFPGLCAVGIAGSVIGCNLFNLAPHRIHLGAAGTSLIGFVIGSLMTLNSDPEKTLAACLILVMTLPGLALLTLLRSGPKGLSPVRLHAKWVSRRFLGLEASSTNEPL